MTIQEAWDFVFKAGWDARIKHHLESLGNNASWEETSREWRIAAMEACMGEANEVTRLLDEVHGVFTDPEPS